MRIPFTAVWAISSPIKPMKIPQPTNLPHKMTHLCWAGTDLTHYPWEAFSNFCLLSTLVQYSPFLSRRDKRVLPFWIMYPPKASSNSHPTNRTTSGISLDHGWSIYYVQFQIQILDMNQAYLSYCIWHIQGLSPGLSNRPHSQLLGPMNPDQSDKITHHTSLMLSAQN